MRLFIAVYPPAEAIGHLFRTVTGLRLSAAAATGAKVRLVDPDRAHLTLAFLGEVDPTRLPAVRQALRLAVATVRSDPPLLRPPVLRPPVLRLGGGGRFGQGRSTVIWVDVRGEVDGLITLAGAVRAELAAIGVPSDDKPLRPHLTIARPGDQLPPTDLDADLATLDDYRGPPWPVTELVLVQTRPGPPPTYHPLTTHPL
ncbi:RNA 2',3'-cyclic phosphodiesterase [Micromonospora sp. NBC_01739]|uniref:RNA 2',3'-cyclic phosphodiesterase n=1 Tax=Micromonospora sp. NBC_01739 TaxID=2975985 RepID=UPI002E1508B7|nr:RNA 2',3'-cyclic phosphodiesterase [Micromonospora sp. NBC_01739]